MEAINKLLFLNKDVESRHQFFKKNMITIEIFENFMMENNSIKEKFVDIDSLKMLFPKTMNIDSRLMKRLVYTDIKSINFALEKLKQNKDIYEQFQMIRKITALVNKIDKNIDQTIVKHNRIRNTNFFDENQFSKNAAVDMIQNMENDIYIKLEVSEIGYLQKIKTMKKTKSMMKEQSGKKK
jgi:hypothetical protein